MFGRFGKDAGSLLGIEITSTAVRLVQLAGRGEGVRAWAIEPLAQGAVVDGRMVAPDSLAAALTQAFKRSGATAVDAALALPASAVMCCEVTMPRGLGDDEIADRLSDELAGVVPYPLDDAAVDFQVMGASAQAPGLLTVAVAVCRWSMVEMIEDVLALAGLRPQIVDIDSHVLQRVACRASGAASAVLMVEVDHLVFHRLHETGESRRDELQGGDAVVQPASIVRALDHWLLSDLERTRGPMPERLLLAGAGASALLAEQLQPRLGVACAVLDPFDGMVGAQDGALRAVAPSLAIACGLACRGVD
ncbi:pilus assembly protein PilM [Pseudomonas laurentiana]|uniref:Pilus assembly protein PilM n=1 Tax=Pseudomonas laurentiana TaxID=2364649 RepID=A0A6I5RSK1_9PSED|nr:pilus assembly protein PilM [Pseudomonas laurentiana]NES10699.1 pilus assembly protein PilM [Pseudomonas laurentiana]GGU61588.1 pilus assembly protein PilM [Pseudomonas laurentiana]